MKGPGARSVAPTLALGLVLFVGGCSLVPAYQRPDVAVPPAWATANAGGLPNAISARGAWWQSFSSDELTALIGRSRTGNFNLQAAVARINEARGAAQIAGAPLYPSINLNGTVDRSNGIKRSGTQALFVQTSYEIDFWGKNRAAANSADTLTNATAFDGETVALTLTASLADTYFQVLSLQERVRLAQEIADSARRILSLIETEVAAGTASDLQIQQQRNQVATFDAAVPALRQQLDQNIHLLAVLTGSTPEGFSVGGQSLNVLAIPEVQADLPATVLRRRPDIQAAEARLVSANFDVGAARAAFYPSIALTGQGGVVSGSLSHFVPATTLTDIAASLVQPIFEGGRLRGQLTFDRAHVIELGATYRQTIITTGSWPTLAAPTTSPKRARC
jgi:NodT family efflux transporter outer membrane factor (OMF) lipoprotein